MPKTIKLKTSAKWAQKSELCEGWPRKKKCSKRGQKKNKKPTFLASAWVSGCGTRQIWKIRDEQLRFAATYTEKIRLAGSAQKVRTVCTVKSGRGLSKNAEEKPKTQTANYTTKFLARVCTLIAAILRVQCFQPNETPGKGKPSKRNEGKGLGLGKKELVK